MLVDGRGPVWNARNIFYSCVFLVKFLRNFCKIPAFQRGLKGPYVCQGTWPVTYGHAYQMIAEVQLLLDE
jgi:hypothetical protein